MSDALQILNSHPASVALVLSTIAFDDSRMIEFLYAAKSSRGGSIIPFICCRVLSTVLSDDAVARVGEVCKLAGAAEFIDVPSLEETSAAAVLSAAVLRHITSAREGQTES
jgi:hypothetical protein